MSSQTSSEGEYLMQTGTVCLPSITTSRLTKSKELKAKLKFFFMNPIEKWQTKRRLPYKFAIQVIKIFLVTFQLCIFAENRYSHMDYAISNKISFSHLFIKSWDATREVLSYPPAAGLLAVYRISTLIEHIDYAVQNYAALNNSIGQFSYVRNEENIPAPVLFRAKYIKDKSFIFNKQPTFVYVSINITVEEAHNFSLNEFMKRKNISINFGMLQFIKLKFDLKANVFIDGGTMCNKFHIEIDYNSQKMNGQMVIDLKSYLRRYACTLNTTYEQLNRPESVWHNVLNISVIFLCSISFMLCLRALFKAQVLKHETIQYFRNVKKVELSMEGRLEFWNFWYVMILINDILIIIGSYMEGNISRNEYANEEWSICSLCLGTGNMLVWFGVLRYFGFFKTYNVVMLTLKRAFPKMMRFLLCTLIIYAGFVFCGWLVLGPFHIKFRSVSTTAENLFSLVNGDDMFATFIILNSRSLILWWYSRIYLYTFIVLFIYVVLNLFLSVILDAYETIKEYYTHGYPKSDLKMFIAESDGEEVDIETEEQTDSNEGPCCFLNSIFCWKKIGTLWRQMFMNVDVSQLNC